jgi:invasion protein IalB
MKKLLLSGIAALFLATGTAHAIIDCVENDPNPICDNPQGWIDQCSKGDKKACKASHDLIAQEEEDEKRSFEDRWHEAKWDCALEWRSDA